MHEVHVRAAGSYWLLSQQPPRGDLRVWYLANRVDSITLQLKWRLFAAGRDYVGISCVSAILGASVLDCAMAEAPYSHVLPCERVSGELPTLGWVQPAICA